jgi:hypothetical protein
MEKITEVRRNMSGNGVDALRNRLNGHVRKQFQTFLREATVCDLQTMERVLEGFEEYCADEGEALVHGISDLFFGVEETVVAAGVLPTESQTASLS